jgi:hypothetical protein
MSEDLLEFGAQKAEKILEKSVACTITKEEHNLPEKYKDSYGWQRYRSAGIIVIDAKYGTVLNLPALL